MRKNRSGTFPLNYKGPLFLALIPTVAVLFIFPQREDRVSIMTEDKPIKGKWMVYADLNGDSVTEIVTASNDSPLSPIGILSNEEMWYDQWNVTDSLVSGISKIYFGDYDHDSKKEIYLFTVKDDSLFININEFFDPAGTRINRRFVSKLGLVNNKLQHTYTDELGFFDQDDDGNSEFYFIVRSGFGLWPRLVYNFDLIGARIKTSPYTSVNLDNAEMKDIDGDGNPEIFGRTYASGNHHFLTPFSDYSAWLMVFDDQLNFKFKPVEYPGFANAITTRTYTSTQGPGLVVSLSTGGAMSDTLGVYSQLMTYGLDGKLRKNRPAEYFGTNRNAFVEVLQTQTGDKLLAISNHIQVLDDNLEIEKTIELPFDGEWVPSKIKLRSDSKGLTLISPDKRGLYFYDDEVVFLGVTHLKNMIEQEAQFSHYHDGHGSEKLFIQSGNDGYLVTLSENAWYWVNYLIYVGFYLSFLFFIFLVQCITIVQVRKQERQKSILREAQLQNIKSQLDPHFTFNALNTIGSMLQLEDRNVAYDYLTKLTFLIRQLVNDNEHSYRALEKELNFAIDYLQLEKIRFEEKFTFSVDIDKSISMKEMVPKMSIQIFVENAIRHGIMPLEKDGLIAISVQRDKDYLIITVCDNGIGFSSTKKYNDSAGRGLKMLREFYSVLNQDNSRPISYSIEDLYADGKAAGTRVQVRVPV